MFNNIRHGPDDSMCNVFRISIFASLMSSTEFNLLKLFKVRVPIPIFFKSLNTYLQYSTKNLINMVVYYVDCIKQFKNIY